MKARILQFRLGVFAAIARVKDGKLQMLVNVRTDQAKQLELAKLPPGATVQIVDLPGGTADEEDVNHFDALVREIHEELKVPRDKIKIQGPKHLLATVNIDFERAEQNAAMVWAAEIDCEPQTSDETSENLWVTEEEITEGAAVRCPGTDVHGRMWQMMMAGFKYWGNVYHDQITSAKSGN